MHGELFGYSPSAAAFSKLAQRSGWRARVVRGTTPLIPWEYESRHGHGHFLRMLQLDQRERLGFEDPGPKGRMQLRAFRKNLADNDAVVAYFPDTEEGFFLVPKRPGIDTGLIRNPDVP